MPRKRQKAPSPENPIETALRKVNTIGQLEKLAGIDRTERGRSGFWEPFASIVPPRASLDAGCAELRRLARERAGIPVS